MDRYHLTLYTGEEPVMHGWWGDRATADRKFTRWIGEHGNVTGARIVLVDEEVGKVIHRWPDEM
ncbi:hypothetical protein MUK60_07065 [Streptomyces sp. LRE541]|uniref:hypothetical protein n=1 Tax=Streptomyces sp. LRE541 TaxID=2931983 RepID=UPI00200EED23|nr:hypothetical protein [Streptomyces sp. LRE541]UPZ27591.1 hypothetical protein MUK60_07065 [Streptomyces sp. LRE541]